MEEALVEEEFVITLTDIKPKRRLRNSLETLMAVDFTGSGQKFALLLDRKSEKGEFKWAPQLCCSNITEVETEGGRHRCHPKDGI